MLDKKIALRLSTTVLFMAAVIDLLRGIAHTYRVRYAAEEIAGIEPNADSLVLMGAFGISNFLTSFIYLLVIWKARQLVPYLLLLIPVSYFVGAMGMRYQNVVMESAFQGQYMLAIYLPVCFFAGLFYFIVASIQKKRSKVAMHEL